MYLIIKWFYSLGKISGIVPEPNLKNWKTEFSREIQEEILHMDSVFQFFCFSVFQFCLRNYSGIFPETFRNICGKLKNWIFQRDPGRDSPYGFSFSVFLFFSFSVLLTELFRNISGDISEYLRETEKLKNRKTEFSREIQEEILHMDSVFQFFCFSIFLFFSFSVFLFFSFSVLLTELFRNICGETEKQKNWIFQRDPGRDSPYGFSFSVFLFFSFAYGTIPEYFRRHFGIFAGNWKTEKQKNWKTEKQKNWIFQRDPGRDSPYGFSFSVFQFFCFSVFQFCGRIGQEELDNCILRVSSLHVM